MKSSLSRAYYHAFYIISEHIIWYFGDCFSRLCWSSSVHSSIVAEALLYVKQRHVSMSQNLCGLFENDTSKSQNIFSFSLTDCVLNFLMFLPVWTSGNWGVSVQLYRTYWEINAMDCLLGASNYLHPVPNFSDCLKCRTILLIDSYSTA